MRVLYIFKWACDTSSILVWSIWRVIQLKEHFFWCSLVIELSLMISSLDHRPSVRMIVFAWFANKQIRVITNQHLEQLVERTVSWCNGSILVSDTSYSGSIPDETLWSSLWSKIIPMWSRWLWQGSFKSLTRVRVPTLESGNLRFLENEVFKCASRNHTLPCGR